MIATIGTRTANLTRPAELRNVLRVIFWRNAIRATPQSWLIIKRALDIAVGSLMMIAAAPLCAAIALAVKLSSPGPVFFVQERVGKNGRPFKLFKFRTMVDGAHLLHKHVAHLNTCDGPALKIPNDPRLHVLGAFLRRSSLDELPQLVNVLRGEMSLVGPRPALPHEVESYAPHYHQRLTVQPGMTGLWQVSGRAEVQFRRWMAMDVWYTRNWSPLVDCWILALTLPAVLRREGAW
jgi:lipopolysaccharide/colanic/teichoic acid biosynthesis glycosyltransferase